MIEVPYMVEMADVITKLVARTEQGRIPWQPAVGESSFSARLGNMAVLISSRDSGMYSYVKLSVLNERGAEIDVAESVDEELVTLYQSAKRTALQSDRKLAELMDLLDAAPPVTPDELAQNQSGRR